MADKRLPSSMAASRHPPTNSKKQRKNKEKQEKTKTRRACLILPPPNSGVPVARQVNALILSKLTPIKLREPLMI
jgi:hypothetical protein